MNDALGIDLIRKYLQLGDIKKLLAATKKTPIIPANGNIFRSRTRIFAVRQGRIGCRVLVAVRKAKPDAALRQKDRAGAENVSVRGYSNNSL